MADPLTTAATAVKVSVQVLIFLGRRYFKETELSLIVQLIDRRFPETAVGDQVARALREDDDVAAVIYAVIAMGYEPDPADLAELLLPHLGALTPDGSPEETAEEVALHILELAPRAIPSLREAVYQEGQASRRGIEGLHERFDDIERQISSAPVPPAVREMEPPSVEELLRGPLEALGLKVALEEAEAMAAGDPRRAADAFTDVAERLGANGFGPYAADVEQRAVEVASAGGAHQHAFDIALDAVLREFDRGGSRPVGSLAPLARNLPPENIRRTRFAVVEAWQQWWESPNEPQHLAAATQLLVAARDAMSGRAALWLAEALLVDRFTGTSAEIMTTLRAGLSFASGQEGLRLRMAIADLDEHDGWEVLREEAKEYRHQPADCSWICSRAGHFLIRQGAGAEAVDAYRDAAKFAHEAKLWGAVSAALINMANAARAEGDWPTGRNLWMGAGSVPDGDTYLPRRGALMTTAIEALAAGKPHVAHGPLRRLLTDAIALGDARETRRLHGLLGRLYEASAEWDLATWHHQHAGQAKQAREAAARSQSGEAPRAQTQEPAERAAAHSALSAMADLLPPAEAAEIGDELLADLNAPRRSPFGPSVSVEASRALAAMALVLSDEQIGTALDFFERVLPRDPGLHTLFDEFIARFLRTVFAARPEHRDRVSDMIIKGLKQDGLGEDLLRELAKIDQGQADLAARIRAAGDLSSPNLRTALEMVDDPIAPSEEEARSAARRLIEREPANESGGSFGGGVGLSLLGFEALSSSDKSAVLERLLGLAQDTIDLEINRAQAVRAFVAFCLVAPEQRPAAAFSAILGLAQPSVELSRIDQMNRAGMHPLSHFKFDLGHGTLRGAALQGAARLADSAEERLAALTSLRAAAGSSEVPVIAGVAWGLAALAGSAEAPLPEEFAVSEATELRAASVWLWTAQSSPRRHLAEIFLSDRDPSVRRVLARALSDLEGNDPDLAGEVRAALLRDQSAYVRWLATQ